ncbi:MAG: UDP-N-acetylglucosamine--N-acetylmuramyl-(pentapeptide) pyrophosphoryl-undecaprenol N-acetylglucosamine transferase [Elusimicrobia bacterium]|nr:UDP-N-acetylglucosamine--N-acetylmuramyl-(pentapeptide) pyrophosphoryl-undecaprenol N-acetylglucosamine transferase [Elusimicrobiota bacterium]
MRVVVAAGGTGGHFYPGLVLCQTLAARGWQPLVLARRADPALSVLEAEGIASAEIDLSGLPRRPSLEWLRFARQAASSVLLCTRILRDFAPRVVVGMGGYLTFPAIAAAARLSLPRAVHDSNVVLGLANRAAVAMGAELFWGLPPIPGAPGAVTGTPIRPQFWRPADPSSARARLDLSPSAATLLVFGGSQGASALNRLVPAAVAEALRRAGGNLQVAHLTGRRDGAEVRHAYAEAGIRAFVAEYFEDMQTAYAAADLVVSRSGASTLAELAALKKPSILVPYPHATGRHQTHNALALSRVGAAVTAPEEKLAGRLPRLLEDLLLSQASAAILSRMGGAFARLRLPAPEETAHRLADAVEALADRHH